VGFVPCEEDFSLPESCPTWLWVAHLCVEDRRVSAGWLTELQSESVTPQVIGQNFHGADLRIGKKCMINDVFAPFKLKAYCFII